MKELRKKSLRCTEKSIARVFGGSNCEYQKYVLLFVCEMLSTSEFGTVTTSDAGVSSSQSPCSPWLPLRTRNLYKEEIHIHLIMLILHNENKFPWIVDVKESFLFFFVVRQFKLKPILPHRVSNNRNTSVVSGLAVRLHFWIGRVWLSPSYRINHFVFIWLYKSRHNNRNASINQANRHTKHSYIRQLWRSNSEDNSQWNVHLDGFRKLYCDWLCCAHLCSIVYSVKNMQNKY